MAIVEYRVHLPEPHAKQRAFIDSKAKRKIIRAGRRGGKTVGVSILAVEKFLAGKRVLYTVPTSEQVDRFWTTITRALYEPIAAGVFKKNETEHIIELPGTEQRIRAKTAWSADTLRGDYGDELIFDEWQLMDEEAWGVVGAPMLLDNNGNATFIYTPPSLSSRSVSKARDPKHAARMFKYFAEEQAKGNPKFAAFHFTSRDNPYLSKEALDEIANDMSSLSYRQEILAEDIDEVPGALWKRDLIDRNRVLSIPIPQELEIPVNERPWSYQNKPKQDTPNIDRMIVGVDPSATSTGDEAGVITAASAYGDYWIISDDSIQASPQGWASAAIAAYHRLNADLIVAESNNGGEMVQQVIKNIDPNVRVMLVHASRGKATRAEPIVALYEQNKVHHVGTFAALEDEMCSWVPGANSPNRLDALVWACTELSNGRSNVIEVAANPFYR